MELNQKHGTDYASTIDQVDSLWEEIYDNICEVAQGTYLGDSIKINVQIEYLPEDK